MEPPFVELIERLRFRSRIDGACSGSTTEQMQDSEHDEPEALSRLTPRARGTSFSTAMIVPSITIQAMLVVPSPNMSRISAQQQPPHDHP